MSERQDGEIDRDGSFVTQLILGGLTLLAGLLAIFFGLVALYLALWMMEQYPPLGVLYVA